MLYGNTLFSTSLNNFMGTGGIFGGGRLPGLIAHRRLPIMLLPVLLQQSVYNLILVYQRNGCF